jgi:opacity protein-like surface antigen
MNRQILAAMLCLLIMSLLAPARAAAEGSKEDVGLRPGVSVGGRAMYDRPKDADHGTMAGGAQVRFHLTKTFALEGSADYRQDKFGGVVTDIMPLQASVLVYPLPQFALTPFILGGGGWYYTHVRRPVDKTTYRFGPHAGAGLQLFLTHNWSVDASYRYLWTEDIHSQDPQHPVGKNFSDNGHMFTAGLNYQF